MQVKSKRNVSFSYAKKIMESSYMGTQSFACISQKTNQIQQTESKQENKYIELIEKLVRLSASEWLNFQEQLRKSYHATWEELKRPETDNEAKTENRLGSPTKTIPPKNNDPKPKPQRSPIYPPTFEVNDRKETKKRYPKGNDQTIHKSETRANLIATEKIPSQSKDPVAPIESKNRYNILERMEIDEPNPTKVKAKKSPK